MADYITESAPDDGIDWAEWLQTKRVELNAMTMPQMIAWLDSKMALHGGGKLIPAEHVLIEELGDLIEDKARVAVRERILREAGFEAQVTAEIARIQTTQPSGSELTTGVKRLFEVEQAKAWRDHIETVANNLTSPPKAAE